MAASTRQTNLLIQEDWKKIYESFQNADFQSYDFETLRKSMIEYIKTYYPEDFNDFLESSEYVALIDLIAFLGQSLAFRADLNARENFIDTAERRDSVLKLAKLIGYSPKRNVPSTGLLRIETVSTSETLIDSNGLDIANLSINWNDSGNDMWEEQWNSILNAAFIASQTVGFPGHTQDISDVRSEEYAVQIGEGIVPNFKFNSTVGGIGTDFEVVSATSINREYLYEVPPKANGTFNMLYRNDNLGNDSIDTGWFMHFRQGEIQTFDFSVLESLPNRVISVNVNDINNTDVWLFQLDSDGIPQTQWTQVPAVSATNVIYNTQTERKLYQLNSRAGDQIDIVFGDGAFADIPLGSFRVFFRTSNGLSYRITPDEMQNIIIPIGYVSRTGREETLTVRANLRYTVNNAAARESLVEIRQKAPQQYYTQDRMVTGEDYNILPYTKFSNILKVKSVNRSSSGVSRYLDTVDVTGKYSATNIFCQDGMLYRRETVDSIDFSVNQIQTDLVSALRALINRDVLNENLVGYEQFIYEKLPRYNTRDITINTVPFQAVWVQSTIGTNQSRGYFTFNTNYKSARTTGALPNPPLKIGVAASNSLKYLLPGSIIKFRASEDNTITPAYFDANHNIKLGTPSKTGDRQYIYATVVQVLDSGGDRIQTVNDAGPVTLSQIIPSGSYIEQVIPKLYTAVTDDILSTASTFIKSKKNFGIRFDQRLQKWSIILPQDLKLSQPATTSTILNTDGVNAEYDETTAGNLTATAADSAWLIAFVSKPLGYRVYYRQINYVFESILETKFYFDNQVRVYDSKTAQVITDNIKVLNSNMAPDSSGPLLDDKTFFIHEMMTDPDGYKNPTRVMVKFSDTNRDGVPDNPDVFTEIVDPTVDNLEKLVFFSRSNVASQYQTLIPIAPGGVIIQYPTQGEITANWNLYDDGQVFYAFTDVKFYVLSVQVIDQLEVRSLISSEIGETFVYYQGRGNLYFQYRHASPGNRRIDPSPNNIIDVYLLEKNYADAYQAWIRDVSGKVLQPTAPTTEQLSQNYATLNNFKAISDTLVFNSAKFKPVFGKGAPAVLKATFKVVKNVNVNISDNEIKVSVIDAINTYFDIANWDFGETFYFSELSAYLHQSLVPNVSSVIIVPTSTDLSFGQLYQINAEPDEIIISTATVDNVQIISAVTAAQLK
jgi:hypothetical protein